jgi:type I restriction enzyme S subunit
MSFPRYPKYKPSGVEWLGDVPEHWEVKQLRHCVQSMASGGTPESGREQYWSSNESSDAIPWVSIGDMTRSSSVQTTDRSLTRLGLESKQLEVFPAGTLLYSMYASLGKVAKLAVPAAINQAILAIQAAPATTDPEFLRHWLGFLEPTLGCFASSNTQENLNAAKVRGLPVSLPPLPEQRAIAAFLDRETAKIDGLVAEQQRLIELLKEKRQAVISHAVTKGLDPKAPMKPSGVEWLGDVPAHWVTRKLTLAFHTIGSGTTPRSDNLAYYEPGEIPWVNTGDLTDGELSSCERLVSRVAIDDYPSLRVYPAGSLLVAMYGATTGKLGLLGFDATVNQACCAFVGNDLIRTRFLFYWLLGYRAQLLSLASGGGQPNISQEVLRGLRVATPTPTEQDRIIEHLLRACDGADALIAEAESAIALLQERRSALISAAVTGQIDVRNAVATEAA